MTWLRLKRSGLCTKLLARFWYPDRFRKLWVKIKLCFAEYTQGKGKFSFGRYPLLRTMILLVGFPMVRRPTFCRKITVEIIVDHSSLECQQQIFINWWWPGFQTSLKRQIILLKQIKRKCYAFPDKKYTTNILEINQLGERKKTDKYGTKKGWCCFIYLQSKLFRSS